MILEPVDSFLTNQIEEFKSETGAEVDFMFLELGTTFTAIIGASVDAVDDEVKSTYGFKVELPVEQWGNLQTHLYDGMIWALQQPPVFKGCPFPKYIPKEERVSKV